MNHRWQPPRACTVIGAAHRRRGSPCQDASLGATLHAPCGADLQLMAVADGHGASRYWLSQVGSQLACEQAHQAVAKALQHTPLAAEASWRELLEEQLPAAISQGWRTAIAADWSRRPEARAQDFEALSYGCTLGLVLLAPRWWGCTGLGDWDLVSVDAGGVAQLRSEERSSLARGEATASLCLPKAELLFADRAHLERLEAEPPPRALVLSTDGVRKSCATDHDFLTLCAQVIDLQDSVELSEGLARISDEGSGDDVSMAIGLKAAEQTTAEPCTEQSLRRWWMATAAALIALGAASGGAWWLLDRRPSPSPTASIGPTAAAAVEAEGRRLCAQPAPIRASLSQRQAQFLRLLLDPAQGSTLLADATRDPLGALIAASRLQRQSHCPALELALQEQWQRARAHLQPPGGKMPAAAPPR